MGKLNPEAKPINQQTETSMYSAQNMPPPAYSEVSSAPAIPQQPAYAPEPPSAPTIPIIQQPRVIVNPRFNNAPTFCTCPHCQFEGVSKTEHSTGVLAWIGCCCCLVFGGWCGCCLIPFCIQGLKNTTHKCHRCEKFIHTHKPL
ncbi:unnamed protein product [Oikopleura dioica]|uniref:LITAF domain-containing protein n=1 Tax=Oikopleura dioica TaxID=34765 RepID=E4YKX4_OIKDI|nr:unnamed protein product [Oikopleura dioica]